MRRLSIVIFAAASTLAACGQSTGTPSSSTESPSSTTAAVQASDLVGKWQFVLTPEVKQHALARIAAENADPAALEKAKAEIDVEAKKEWVEFTTDEYRSMVGDALDKKEAYSAVSVDGQTLTVKQGSHQHTIVFRDHDTIVINDPEKGDLVFTRIK